MVLKDTGQNKNPSIGNYHIYNSLWYNILVVLLKLRYVSIFDHVRFLIWPILLCNLKTL